MKRRERWVRERKTSMSFLTFYIYIFLRILRNDFRSFFLIILHRVELWRDRARAQQEWMNEWITTTCRVCEHQSTLSSLHKGFSALQAKTNVDVSRALDELSRVIRWNLLKLYSFFFLSIPRRLTAYTTKKRKSIALKSVRISGLFCQTHRTERHLNASKIRKRDRVNLKL